VKVMLPKFDNGGFMVIGILEDIARIIAYSRYKRLRAQNARRAS